jgi:hypothetical protein
MSRRLLNAHPPAGARLQASIVTAKSLEENRRPSCLNERVNKLARFPEDNRKTTGENSFGMLHRFIDFVLPCCCTSKSCG